tara:strand:- start:143 stop:472 length:330 start_codon:yes stop_codon:yes gene_type:complete
MQIYNLVKDDTAPQVKATLTRQDTGAAINFAGGSCRLKFRAKGSSTTLFTLLAADVGDNFQDGIAIFSFSAGNLDTQEGYYEGELEVTYADDNVETIYEVLNFYLRADF